MDKRTSRSEYFHIRNYTLDKVNKILITYRTNDGEFVEQENSPLLVLM